ncbi:TadE family protein [Pseudomonas gingeri]|uniref:TadE family protein n=1 Tax=Pseudomonas gingeri TaxID=117681 RepID=UPI0015A09135|nr:TadE/TadG family type IV pilus assembly protein [Pseudomonas gingeri]NWD09132.1 pilus assembly protein [Pseudomonas gingeri]NWE35025.1 pilus assembly protein [Pseudomonas gingeri]NWE60735.1 pilus assembly protein [Pseudomonas gingeri]NWF01186.1 pilus assembly protein [Pseudomonas gingeri]
MTPSLPGKQKGAAAIEFALVFVIFFAVLYGLVSYSLPLLMMQSFNAATAEAARQAVAVDPNAVGYPALVQTTAKAAAQQRLGWIPMALNFQNGDITTQFTDAKVLTVTISYPTSRLRNVLPFLVLPGIGTVPNLPDTLTSTTSMQF